MLTHMVSTLLLFCIIIPPIQVSFAQSTCSIDDITYMEGDVLEFSSRCGSPEEFPCFCQPNAPSQVDCPYCGIATVDNAEGLVCARLDGPVVNVTTLEGERKECSCRRDSDGKPETVCFNQGSNPYDTPSASPPSDTTVCTMEWADGSIIEFVDGQSYEGLVGGVCQPRSEFPCFCNVSIPGKIYCPYCSVPNNMGDVACGSIGETFQLVDENGQTISCQCQSDLSTDCAPVSATGTPTPLPTLPPTLAPTLASTSAGSSPTIRPLFVPSPTMVQTTTSSPSPTLVPTVTVTTTRPPSAPLPTLDKPSILLPTRTPPVSIPIPGCSYINQTTGGEEFTATGESLTAINGPCSPLETFPVICNPALPGGMEYPYCVFVVPPGNHSATSTGRNTDSSVVCGKNGDQVQVPTTEGTIQTCSCIYLNPFIGAVSSCPDLVLTIPLSSTMTPNAAPSSAPTLPVPGPVPVPNQGPPPIASPDTETPESLNASGHALGQTCPWSLTSMVTILSLFVFALFSI